MPFKSTKQMKYMMVKHPGIARKWLKKYGPAKSKEDTKNKYSEALVWEK